MGHSRRLGQPHRASPAVLFSGVTIAGSRSRHPRSRRQPQPAAGGPGRKGRLTGPRLDQIHQDPAAPDAYNSKGNVTVAKLTGARGCNVNRNRAPVPGRR